MTGRLADRIAVVNGLLVLLGAVAIGLLPREVRPWTPVSIFPVAAVLALIASWRSRVHARGWIKDPGPAWRGVIEAAALGPVITALVLTPAIVTRLVDRDGLDDATGMVAFVLSYSAPMVPIGLTSGLILRAVGLFQLRRAASAPGSQTPHLQGPLALR